MGDDAVISKQVLVEVQDNGIVRTTSDGGQIIARLNPLVDYDLLEEQQKPQWDLNDIMVYAATVFEPMFDEENERRMFSSLGQEIAYAALCAAAGQPLTDRQEDLIEHHTRDGKVKP